MKSSKKSAQKKSVAKKVIQKPAPMQKPVAPKMPPFKIQPLHDRVIIKEDTESKEQTTASGIIIPVSAQEDKGSKRGKVVAVGNGRLEDGKLVPLTVSTGDKVLFQWGDKVRVDNEDYYIVRESEILAVIH
jgi:chaperonin GroES